MITREQWESCESPSELLRYAADAGVELRPLVLAACDCARAVLHIVPEKEDRPRRAIEVAEAWCRDEATPGEVADAVDDASRAADTAATWPVPWAVTDANLHLVPADEEGPRPAIVLEAEVREAAYVSHDATDSTYDAWAAIAAAQAAANAASAAVGFRATRDTCAADAFRGAASWALSAGADPAELCDVIRKRISWDVVEQAKEGS